MTILASEITSKFKLSDDGVDLFKANYTVIEFISVLRDEQRLIDAIKMYAHSLPIRHAIYWAYLCFTKELSAETDAARMGNLVDVLSWIKNPSEDKRRPFKSVYDELGFKHPIGCLAIAIFWSEGSISGADNPAVPAPPNVANEAVANAIVTRCIEFGDAMSKKLSTALDVGSEIIAKKHHW
ncbi:MAG TPA: hypothetical protein DEO41_06255 [Betaproteobacteria bacterium]|jgi:hypothetical protein|nr:hypothetical protein [Betaproteobacteria bacterium]|tara:strand:- start:3536 stop:4081 length:546 start_codon:yes stop_codon:yes gene_type:complete